MLQITLTKQILQILTHFLEKLSGEKDQRLSVGLSKLQMTLVQNQALILLQVQQNLIQQYFKYTCYQQKTLKLKNL